MATRVPGRARSCLSTAGGPFRCPWRVLFIVRALASNYALARRARCVAHAARRGRGAPPRGLRDGSRARCGALRDRCDTVPAPFKSSDTAAAGTARAECTSRSPSTRAILLNGAPPLPGPVHPAECAACGFATNASANASAIAVPSGSNKWLGGVLGPDGRIYGIPSDHNAVLVVDPSTCKDSALPGVRRPRPLAQ